MIRSLLSPVFLVFAQVAFAQQEGSGKAVSAEVAATAIPPGVYKGRVVLQGRTRNSEFELDLRQHPGKVSMFLSPGPCRASLPMSITSVNNGLVRLEMVPVQIMGCDRVFEIRVTGNELIGTSKSTNGIYDLQATKQ